VSVNLGYLRAVFAGDWTVYQQIRTRWYECLDVQTVCRTWTIRVQVLIERSSVSRARVQWFLNRLVGNRLLELDALPERVRSKRPLSASVPLLLMVFPWVIASCGCALETPRVGRWRRTRWVARGK